MRFSASSATEPSVTITRGFTSSIVRRRNSEQFCNSFCVGLRFAPESERGLQRAALVMKISSRFRSIEFKKRSRFAPDWSPENGTRVRSAPFLPGASPTNITRASGEPLSSLNTAVRPHIAGQRVHAAASRVNSVNSLALFNCDLTRDDVVVAVTIRPAIWSNQLESNRVLAGSPTSQHDLLPPVNPLHVFVVNNITNAIIAAIALQLRVCE